MLGFDEDEEEKVTYERIDKREVIEKIETQMTG